MLTPRLDSVQCLSPAGLHRMAYAEWGDPDNPKVLVCVHGLTRVGNDFDELAQTLAHEYRVVCPDVVGRGRSDWLRDPQHYHILQYVSDMVTLLARVKAGSLHWVGTSMGGMIGMALAGMPNTPIQKMVLNDVGPRLQLPALLRIGDYLGKPVSWTDFGQAVGYIAAISAPFGPHTPAQWERLARHVVRQGEDGRWTLHYDPKMAAPFKALTAESAAAGEAALWAAYDAIACPVLVIRGEHSDLLTQETAQQMTERGPRAELVQLPGIGHAPTLIHPEQIAVIQRFLLN